MWKKYLSLSVASVFILTNAVGVAHAAKMPDGGQPVNEAAAVWEQGVLVETPETAQSTSGTYKPYEGAKYSLMYEVGDEGVVITGIADYESKDDLGRLEIPVEIDGMKVTGIGSSAFIGCSGLTGSLTLPESLTDIGDYAFYNCSGFTGSLMIPKGMTSISRAAFEGCSGFKGSLTLPESLTNIGDFAFFHCSGFTGSLTLPESLTDIGESAFNDCSGFTGSLTLPEGLTDIGHGAFMECSGFTGSLTIHKNVKFIGYRAFYGCSGFTGSLTLPEGLTDIGEGAFEGCNFDLTPTATPTATPGATNVPTATPTTAPTATPGATNAPTATPTTAPTATPGATNAPTATPGATNTPTATPPTAPTATPGATNAPTATPGATNAPTATPGATNVPTATPGATNAPTETPPTAPTATPGATNTPTATPGATNVPTATPGINPTQTPPAPTEPTYDTQGLVERFYSELLGRTATDEEIAGWKTALDNGTMTAIHVGYMYVDSPEFKDKGLKNDEYLDKLYKTFMNREPDPLGKAFWLERLDAGFTRDYVYLNFAVLPEFTEICEKSHIRRGEIDEIGKLKEANEAYSNRNIEVSKYVTRCYTKVLNRAADAEGVEFWCGQIITKMVEAKTAAEFYVLSEEFIGRNMTNEQYIEVLYQTFFGREGDKAGADHWLGQLASKTMTREDVLHTFSATEEFAGILAGFGL